MKFYIIYAKIIHDLKYFKVAHCFNQTIILPLESDIETPLPVLMKKAIKFQETVLNVDNEVNITVAAVKNWPKPFLKMFSDFISIRSDAVSWKTHNIYLFKLIY